MADPTQMASIARIPVSPGFTWTSAFTALGSVSTLGLVTLIIKKIGPWRKQLDEAVDAERASQGERIKKLEEDLREAQTRHDTQIAELRAEMASERARHEAQISLYRHKSNNQEACLDAVLILLEVAPERGPEVSRRIREMREGQKIGEATEAAAIHAAEIAAKAKGSPALLQP